jgi:hypothetical protein
METLSIYKLVYLPSRHLPSTVLTAVYCSDGRWSLFVGPSVAPNKQGVQGTADRKPRGCDLSHVDAILEFVAGICSDWKCPEVTMPFALPSPPCYSAKSHTIHGSVVGKYGGEGEGVEIQRRGGIWHCSWLVLDINTLHVSNTDSLIVYTFPAHQINAKKY